jgi:CheY-like chemotaxis protein
MTFTPEPHNTKNDEAIHILHVDDEPDFAELTASFLERDNNQITVRTATRADEGLALLADSDIDGVISDYDMPG